MLTLKLVELRVMKALRQFLKYLDLFFKSKFNLDNL